MWRKFLLKFYSQLCLKRQVFFYHDCNYFMISCSSRFICKTSRTIKIDKKTLLSELEACLVWILDIFLFLFFYKLCSFSSPLIICLIIYIKIKNMNDKNFVCWLRLFIALHFRFRLFKFEIELRLESEFSQQAAEAAHLSSVKLRTQIIIFSCLMKCSYLFNQVTKYVK